MTTASTGRLLHDLVAGTHAEGITALAVRPPSTATTGPC